MQYDVRALSPDNLMSQFIVDAHDEADARRQVVARGLCATSVKPAGRSIKNAFSQKNTGSRLSLVLFSQELLALLTAGLSIVECLEALLEKEASDASRSILTRLLSGLREGKRFSAVLSEQSDLFPPLYIGIVKAAEGTSDLPRSLTRYIDYQQRIDIVRAKIISAAIYPMILLLVGGGVSLFLIGYVVPRFAEVYKGAGRDLPWLSKVLLDWGQFAGAHTTMMVSSIIVGLLLIVATVRHFLSSGGMARLIYRLPGIGERARIYELSRLYLTLGMLLEGGISIVPAMETVHGMVSANIKQGLRKATESIQSGTPLSSAFEANQLTTPISLRMFNIRTPCLGISAANSPAKVPRSLCRHISRTI